MKYKSILITGGTGSFGQKFVHSLLGNKKIKRIVIFSRDELKQSEMAEKFSLKKYPNIRYFLGDIRDKDRLYRAFKNIELIVHAAALKHVPIAENNPTEFIKTNIIGTQNIIEVATDMNIKKVISLSTDKAASPINLYGATKLCADKLVVAANDYINRSNISFSVCRYGNVMGSRGSIIPILLKQIKHNKVFNLTDPNMTRFNITLEDSVKMVNFMINNSVGSEILIPKIPSYKVIDLMKAIDDKRKIKIVGIRPGEKIHEDLVTSNESDTTYDIGKYYILLPNNNKETLKKFKNFNLKKVNKNFNYNSGTNINFLSVKSLKKILKNQKLLNEF